MAHELAAASITLYMQRVMPMAGLQAGTTLDAPGDPLYDSGALSRGR